MTMWCPPLLAMATLVYMLLAHPAVLITAAPILVLWCASPGIVLWFSLPLGRRGGRLTDEQIRYLRKLSRKTWAFFETFVTPEDHWLPPDNYQEYRVATVAHRTSPTNMGLALLANLSAYDFGYIPAGQCIDRTENALCTMESIERHRGHFYNWYDTQSLKPLLPAYISTVDSGNLAAHLLTLRAGLLALPDHRILGPQIFHGLGDAYGILADLADRLSPKGKTFARIQKLGTCLASSCTLHPVTPVSAHSCLELLAASADEVIAGLNAPDTDPENEAGWWARAFAGQCRSALNDLVCLDALTMSNPDAIPTLRELAELGSQQAAERIARIDRLARRAGELARMDYDFLFDPTRKLLSVGYNVGERRRDASFYDLLASEARLACFVAIAQGQLPQESWFALGRLLTSAGGEPILLSWSGSMFEYLMPLLVMPTYEYTLLDQTYKAAVERQIAYGKQCGVPWGVSESGYNMVDIGFNYQYRAFGVPGLGLKRGLADDLVIAPYASALALMVAPEEACLNLQRLSAEGFEVRYGFYEAVDYTPSRQRRKQEKAVIRSFMAHHQGMSLLSLAYVLLDRPMQKRFGSDPCFRQQCFFSMSGFRGQRLSILSLPRLQMCVRFPAARKCRCVSSAIQTLRHRKYNCFPTGDTTCWSRTPEAGTAAGRIVQ